MKLSSMGLTSTALGLLFEVIGNTRAFAQETQLTSAEAPSHRFCATCHGTDGIGNESIRAPRLAGMEPWYLKRQLELFRSRARGTHPEDIDGMEMQPMAEILTDAHIEDIVEWAGAWQYIKTAPTITEGNPLRGRELFKPCESCHGDEAQGNQAMNAPALQGQNDWYLIKQLNNFKVGIRGNTPSDTFGPQMRAAASTLNNEQDIIDVTSYINTLGR